MNWSKAKTILIVALIITDLFLIFTYSGISFKSDDFEDNETLVEFLAQKNIYVDADTIPPRHRDMPVLFVQKEEIDVDEATKALLSFASAKTPLLRDGNDADYIEAVDSYLDSYLERFQDGQANVVFESITEDAAAVRVERDGEYTKVIYSNTVTANGESIPIEKSYLIFTFKDGIINYVEGEWLSTVNFHNRKQKTISAAQALLLFLATETTARDSAEGAEQIVTEQGGKAQESAGQTGATNETAGQENAVQVSIIQDVAAQGNQNPENAPQSNSSQDNSTRENVPQGGEKIHIDSIEMIYWLDESSLDTETTVSADTALPVWKITYTRYSEATQIREAAYIDAYEHQ